MRSRYFALLVAATVSLAIGGVACTTPSGSGGGGQFNAAGCYHATANSSQDMYYDAAGNETTYSSTNGTCTGNVLGNGYAFHWANTTPTNEQIIAKRQAECAPRGFPIMWPMGLYLKDQNPAMANVWLCAS